MKGRPMSNRSMLAKRDAAQRRQPYRPELEILEDRTLPSVGAPFNIFASAKNETTPVTASSPDGVVSVAVWAKEAGPGNRNIYAQEFISHAPVGSVILLASSTDDEFAPAVTMRDDYVFAVVWTHQQTFSSSVGYALINTDGPKVIAAGDFDNAGGAE